MALRELRLSTLLILMFASACSSDCSPTDPCAENPIIAALDRTEFSTLPRFEDLDFEALTPGSEPDVWDLHEYRGRRDIFTLLFRRGSIQPEELPVDIRQAFFAEPNPGDGGFGNPCIPGVCFKRIVSVAGSQVRISSNAEDLRIFLSPIDSPVEAVVMLSALHFWWTGDPRSSGIATVDTGFRLLALQQVSGCNPVQHDRVLLHIAADGMVTEEARDTWILRRDSCPIS
jgi:hypothetical protein